MYLYASRQMEIFCITEILSNNKYCYDNVLRPSQMRNTNILHILSVSIRIKKAEIIYDMIMMNILDTT